MNMSYTFLDNYRYKMMRQTMPESKIKQLLRNTIQYSIVVVVTVLHLRKGTYTLYINLSNKLKYKENINKTMNNITHLHTAMR